MTANEGNDNIIIPLPKEFDMKVNLGYLTRDKNECMYEIEYDRITKAKYIGKIHFLIQINAIENKQMVIKFLGDIRPTEK